MYLGVKKKKKKIKPSTGYHPPGIPPIPLGGVYPIYPRMAPFPNARNAYVTRTLYAYYPYVMRVNAH